MRYRELKGEKRKKHSTAKTLLRTNVAIGLVYQFITTFLNIKQQHVQGMYDDYEAANKLIHAHYKGLQDGTIPRGTPSPVPPLNNFSVEKQDVRVEKLEDVLEDLTVTGRPIHAASVLRQSAMSLNMLLGERDAMLQKLKAETNGGQLGFRQIAFMFALPVGKGADFTFQSNVRGIQGKTNKSIHFCRILYEDLYAHGKTARAAYTKKYRSQIPEITELSFDKGKAATLFPDRDEYKDWDESFVTRPRSPDIPLWRKVANHGVDGWNRLKSWVTGIHYKCLLGGTIVVTCMAVCVVAVFRLIEKNILLLMR